MLDKLFGSKTRVVILSLFFSDPGQELYIQEVIKRTGLDPASVHRELTKLKELEILASRDNGNQKNFYLNSKSPYLDGLKNLLKTYEAESHKDAFFLFEEFFGYGPQIAADFMNVAVSNALFEKLGLKSRLTKTITIYEDEYWKAHFIKQEFDDVSREIVDLMIQRPEFFVDFNRELMACSNELMDFSNSVLATNLSGMTDIRLGELYEKAFSLYEKAHMMGWPQNAADFGQGMLSKYLRQYLSDRLGLGRQGELNDLFIALTTPEEESYAQKEWRELVKIYDRISSDPVARQLFAGSDLHLITEELPQKNEAIHASIRKHAKEFGFLGYGATGPAWNEDYFIDILASFARQGKRADALSEEAGQNRKASQKTLADWELAAGLDEKHKAIFNIARSFVFTKGFRKDVMFHHWWVMENVLREIGRRKYLSLKQVRFMHPREISALMKGLKVDTSDLSQRPKFSVFFSDGTYDSDVILIGEKAKDFLSRFEFVTDAQVAVNELHGECASPGKVRGLCKIVNSVADMAKMEKGDILISLATSPELVPAIKQAAAIVTNAGGITCHAAIISRELAIPCVIGTKNATKVLRDGDLVDVDAGHGKVSILERSAT